MPLGEPMHEYRAAILTLDRLLENDPHGDLFRRYQAALQRLPPFERVLYASHDLG
jgi:hypothetical protein